MSGSKFLFAKAGLLATSLGASLLAGCSGRDEDSAERIAEINAAAARAENAAKRAESAVAKMHKAAAPIPEIEPEPEEPSPEDAPPADEPPPSEL